LQDEVRSQQQQKQQQERQQNQEQQKQQQNHYQQQQQREERAPAGPDEREEHSREGAAAEICRQCQAGSVGAATGAVLKGNNPSSSRHREDPAAAVLALYSLAEYHMTLQPRHGKLCLRATPRS
jgi:hypothetical protein